MENILKPPKDVRGLFSILNTNVFNKDILVFCLKINDNKKIRTIMPLVKTLLLKLEKFRPVQSVENTCNNTNSDIGESLIFFNPQLINKWDDFPECIKTKLLEENITEQHGEMRNFTLKYENYSIEALLKSVLPEDKEGLSSFTKIGHIVHVNLRDHLLPYKEIIGKILLDKVPNCRTVVNKANIIDNTYRNFKMELLAGDNDFLATVKENGCSFQFDFATVYWNSRLCTEHERIINIMKPGDVLFDVFAGVGPFSIPSAKKKCFVYANDLNPESFKWLNFNAKLNKINETYLKTFNKDGHDFIFEDIKELLWQQLNDDKANNKVYITMNLPAMATEFLSDFIGLFNGYSRDFNNKFHNLRTATIFVYCFAKGVNTEQITRELVNRSVGSNAFDTKIVDIFKVRNVSNLKEMMRITINLDKDILFKISDNKKRNITDTTRQDKKFKHGEEKQQESQ